VIMISNLCEKAQLIVLSVTVAGTILPCSIANASDDAKSSASCMSTLQVEAASVSLAKSTVTSRPSASQSYTSTQQVLPCFIDWAQAKAEKRLVIDIRSRNAFAQLSSSGSLNIPAENLLLRDFLRKDALLLVDDGKAPHEMSKLCSLMSEAGFVNVRALSGGVRALSVHGNSLNGSPTQIASMALLSAQEFHTIRQRPEWRILSIEPVAANAGIRIDHHGLSIDMLINILRYEHAKSLAEAWVVVGLTEVARADFMNRLPADLFPRTFFLAPSLQQYAAYVNQQNMMVASAGRPLVRPCTEW
jgi:rhodanese-related sulfurtransferase